MASTDRRPPQQYTSPGLRQSACDGAVRGDLCKGCWRIDRDDFRVPVCATPTPNAPVPPRAPAIGFACAGDGAREGVTRADRHEAQRRGDQHRDARAGLRLVIRKGVPVEMDVAFLRSTRDTKLSHDILPPAVRGASAIERTDVLITRVDGDESVTTRHLNRLETARAIGQCVDPVAMTGRVGRPKLAVPAGAPAPGNAVGGQSTREPTSRREAREAERCRGDRRSRYRRA